MIHCIKVKVNLFIPQDVLNNTHQNSGTLASTGESEWLLNDQLYEIILPMDTHSARPNP